MTSLKDFTFTLLNRVFVYYNEEEIVMEKKTTKKPNTTETKETKEKKVEYDASVEIYLKTHGDEAIEVHAKENGSLTNILLAAYVLVNDIANKTGLTHDKVLSIIRDICFKQRSLEVDFGAILKDFIDFVNRRK